MRSTIGQEDKLKANVRRRCRIEISLSYRFHDNACPRWTGLHHLGPAGTSFGPGTRPDRMRAFPVRF